MSILAAILSAICPGLGQIYNGDWLLGGGIMTIASIWATLFFMDGLDFSRLVTGTNFVFFAIYVVNVMQAYTVEKK